MEKNVFEGFAGEIILLKNERTEVTSQIKEAIESFAAEHNLDKKVVRKGLKVYEDYLKDSAETVEFAALVNDICFEAAPEEAEETEE